MFTVRVTCQAESFPGLAARLREVAADIEAGFGNGRRASDFDYEVAHGANLDVINEILCASPDFEAMRVAFSPEHTETRR